MKPNKKKLDTPYKEIIQSYQKLFTYMSEQSNPKAFNDDEMFWITRLESALKQLKQHDISLDDAIHYLELAIEGDGERFKAKHTKH
ncbi:TPA: hypothetical protein ACN1V3_001404 [Staphylococcus aureus]